ncbi:hypothetical protein ACFQV4_20010 [Streptomyces thermocarboxydus]
MNTVLDWLDSPRPSVESTTTETATGTSATTRASPRRPAAQPPSCTTTASPRASCRCSSRSPKALYRRSSAPCTRGHPVPDRLARRLRRTRGLHRARGRDPRRRRAAAVLTDHRLAPLAAAASARAGTGEPWSCPSRTACPPTTARPAGRRNSPCSSSPPVPAVPPGVRVTGDNLTANVRAIHGWLGVTGEDSCSSWLPLYHDMGLIGTFLGSVVAQIDLWLMSPSTSSAPRPAGSTATEGTG